MKNFLLALMVVLTTCTLAVAQNQNPVAHDSISQTEPTLVVDTDATDSIAKENVTTTDTSNHSVLYNLSNAMEDVLIPIIAIIAVFGFPVFILFIIFFFRYKNRKARYRLAEQALAAGQPLPEEFIRENKSTDQRTQGIKNTFTGIGLFIFLWAITGEFGIGAIGLLVMFMGLGQWLIGYKQHANEETKNRETAIRSNDIIISEKNDEEKNEENRCCLLYTSDAADEL